MGRTPCCNAELGLKKGAWTSDEDQKLIAYIKEHGEGGWRTLPEKAGLQRCGKSCRLRWTNYLRPNIKRGEFAAEEEQKIFQLHATLGNRWSAIARNLPMRTDNEIKNYWNTHLKKRLLDVGVDPVTQNPPETSSSAPSTNPQLPPPSVSSIPSSLPPSSVSSSAQRLNMLASKIASSSISHCNIVNGDKDLSLRGPSHSDSPSSSSSSNSSSARLLNKMANRLSNKMANRLSSPLHCLNTLKTILSRTADSNNDNSDYLQRSTSASSLSESTVSDVSRSISASTGILNDQTATYSYPNNLSPFNHLDDLDLLKDWHAGSDGVVSSSCGVESPVVQGCGGNHESAELENLLGTYRDEVNNDLMITFRATYEHDDMAMDMGHDVSQYLLDGITNHYAVDDAPPHFMSASNTDSRNAAESDGGENFELSTYDDFNLEYCNFSIMSESDNIF